MCTIETNREKKNLYFVNEGECENTYQNTVGNKSWFKWHLKVSLNLNVHIGFN